MGPKQRGTTISTRAVPYDLDLPENWTNKKLREELVKLGVTVNSAMKKSQLITMFKEASFNSRGNQSTEVNQSSVTDSDPGRMWNSSNNNIRNSQQDGVLSAISQLSDTLTARLTDSLSSMRSDINLIQQRINTMERSHSSAAAAAGSFQQVARDAAPSLGVNFNMSAQSGSQETSNHGSNDTDATGRYTLQTAITAHASDGEVPWPSPRGRYSTDTMLGSFQPDDPMTVEVNRLWELSLPL
ncbi:uncharacterized protein LOC117317516 [Pecten maximus]|uniref:uncharacterized protein LOC117317516 n=1 Tax=Pecten maximus TaxID=6579 RepID=UPI001458647E|nr:uncharacterized protein LOC117317516 [Pecten maximus]